MKERARNFVHLGNQGVFPFYCSCIAQLTLDPTLPYINLVKLMSESHSFSRSEFDFLFLSPSSIEMLNSSDRH